MTISPIQALDNHAEARPNNVAFIYGEDPWTYERLAAESKRLAYGFLAQGVEKGDRIVLHMLNRPEMIVAYYACFRIGTIATPLWFAYKAAELKPILERLQPALYIGQPDSYREVAAVDPSVLPAGRRFTVSGAVEAAGTKPWASLLEHAPHQALPSADIQAPAVLMSTSGTTGTSKLVIHTQATLAAIAEALALKCAEIDSSQIAVEAMPLAHVSGLYTFLAFMRFGAKFVLLGHHLDAGAVLDAIERHKCTWFAEVPASAVALLERQKAQPRKVDSLRFCATGADVCPLPLQKEFPKVFGTPLRSLWGATETMGSLTYGLEDGPVSRIVEGSEVRLVDDTGVPVPRGEIGELVIRGPNVSPGYWAGPGKIDGVPQDGWYRTGDLMRQDEKGDLWFVSRKKHIIIRYGDNISPVEVERVLLDAHPAVEGAAVIGVPDQVLGERVAGFVQLRPGTSSSVLSEILASAKTQLSDYKVPEQLEIIEAIPRNALGKIDRAALLAIVQQQKRSKAA